MERTNALVLCGVAVLLAAGAGHSQSGGPVNHPAGERRVVIGFEVWREPLVAAADRYKLENPGVNFILVRQGDFDRVERFVRGEIDLLAVAHPLDHYRNRLRVRGGDAPQPLEALPEEHLIGYWPLAVVVHPQNPLESLRMEQLHRLATTRGLTWKNLGRDEDGAIRMDFSFSTIPYIADALFGPIYVDDSEPASGGIRSDDRMRIEVNFRSYRINWGLIREPQRMAAWADDPDLLAIWQCNRRLIDSGLKVLPIHSEPDGRAYHPTDTAAVFDGRYPLRIPFRLLVHANASEDTRAFVQWLATPAGHEAMRSAGGRDYEYNMLPWPLALAGGDSSIEESAGAGDVPTVAIPFDGEISGAAAVLPVTPQSMHLLTVRAEHHAAYEQAITDAIAADGRLDLVDRQQIRAVLDEWKIDLLRGEAGAGQRQFVTADVFVVAAVEVVAGRPRLRLDAIHGPTAASLGRTSVPIASDRPGELIEQLDRAVRNWWPDVLRQLEKVRTRPIWVLRGIYASEVEQITRAAGLQDRLASALAADEKLLLVQPVPLASTQREALLAVAGLSRSSPGQFAPAADYLIDGRLERRELIIRLRDGGGETINEASLAPMEDDLLVLLVADWLQKQADRLPQERAERQASLVGPDDWSRAQAQLELELAEQIRVAYNAVHEASAVWTPTGPSSTDGRRTLHVEERRVLAERYWQHVHRAVQLDPISEPAARLAAGTYHDFVPRTNSDAVGIFARREKLEAMRHYLETFPDSPHFELTLYYYAMLAIHTGMRASEMVPPMLDPHPFAAEAFEQGLAALFDFCEQYVLSGKISIHYGTVESRYGHYATLLGLIEAYLRTMQPPPAEQERLLREWERRFDSHAGEAIPSEFLRLAMLEARGDTQGYLDLLAELQRRWPDPYQPPWVFHTRHDTPAGRTWARESVRQAMHRLFRDEGYGRAFEQWIYGRAELDDLPWMRREDVE